MMCMMYGHYLFKHWEEMMQVNKLVIKKFMLSEMSLTFLQVVSCIAQCTGTVPIYFSKKSTVSRTVEIKAFRI